MRIIDSKAVAETRKTAKMARPAGVPFFILDEVDPAEEAPATFAAAGSVNGIGDIAVLLAVQGYENRRQQREEAIRRGTHTLDALDGLKLDLLSGRVSQGRLSQIAALAYVERSGTDEPRLDSILSQIELRARVELAKLESRRG